MRLFPMVMALGLLVPIVSGGETQMKSLTGKRVVLVIASQNFRDEEFSEPYDLLTRAGATVKVACSKLTPARGMLGKVVTPDLTLADVRVEELDALIFIGGSGATEYYENPIAHKLAVDAVQRQKILGAICLGPGTLARAGVLKDKKATCFLSASTILEQGGAKLVRLPVVQDGKIITGNGPQAAKLFAEAILNAL